MIDEKKIKELEKRISSPHYSESLPDKNSTKTDIAKLKKLAKEIRKTVEDYTIEPTTPPVTGSRP
ncbi:MAG TPA: hypothetical protein VLF90_04390 [Patescibacteria group bacterium]|nr:hypothetical protein [Patescibacteria group bacterium]